VAIGQIPLMVANDEIEQPGGPEQLPQEPHRRQRPSPFRNPRHLQVDEPVKANDHAEAREDLRVLQRRHPGEPEEPLRVQAGVQTPANVVDAGCDDTNRCIFLRGIIFPAPGLSGGRDQEALLASSGLGYFFASRSRTATVSL
jgi:hypothetical protein